MSDEFGFVPDDEKALGFLPDKSPVLLPATPATERAPDISVSDVYNTVDKALSVVSPSWVGGRLLDTPEGKAAVQGFGQVGTMGFLPWLQARFGQGMEGVRQISGGEAGRGVRNITEAASGLTPGIGMFSAPRSEDFERLRREAASSDASIKKANPYSYGAGGLAAAVMTPSPLGKAGAAGITVKMGLPQKMARFGLEGLTSGVLTGAGEAMSQDKSPLRALHDVTRDAGLSTALSAVSGPAMAAGTQMLGKGIQSLAQKSPQIVDWLRKKQYEAAFKATLEPYFSDSKELINQANRQLSTEYGVPAEQVVQTSGKYLSEAGVVPKYVSDASKSLPLLKERAKASGELMGDALQKGQAAWDAYNLPNITPLDVAGRVASEVPSLSYAGGQQPKVDATLTAARRLAGMNDSDMGRTLPEWQRHASNAYANVNFKDPVIADQAALIEGAAAKDALRMQLEKISSPDFKEWASKMRWPEPKAARAPRTPTAGPDIVDAELRMLQAPKEGDFSALSPAEYRRIFGEQPRLMPENNNRDWRFPEEYSATGPGLARGDFPGGANAVGDAQREAFRGATDFLRNARRQGMPQLPEGPVPSKALPGSGEAVPQGAYDPTESLAAQYEKGNMHYGINTSLADIAQGGVGRRLFNRMVTPTAKMAGGAGGVAGMLFGGPVGAVAGAVLAGGAARASQKMVDPAIHRGAKSLAELVSQNAGGASRFGQSMMSEAPQIAAQYGQKPVVSIQQILGLDTEEERLERSGQNFVEQQ